MHSGKSGAQKRAASMFLTRALSKILSEKETKKVQHIKLREACEASLALIQGDLSSALPDVVITPGELLRDQLNSTSPMPPPNKSDNVVDADKHFLPFKLACESKNPRIITTSLDCLQKLIAYGLLRGATVIPGRSPPVRLIDEIVDTICACFIGDFTDENVQLQIIKALLTIVSSNSCEVHEGTLLKVVRTIYNVYLASKNLVNQYTAKATLTQMLNIIFQRMELQAASEVEDDDVASHPILLNGGSINESTDTIDHATSSMVDIRSIVVELVNGAVAAVGEEEHDSHIDSGTVNGINGVEMNGVREVDMGNGGTPEAIDDDRLSTSSGSVSHHSKASVVEATILPPASLRGMVSVDAVPSVRFTHLLQKDAFLVFRSLCKLSMKPLPLVNVDPKSHELRSKKLSLELLLSVLQSAGPVFRTSDAFVDAVKQYLCLSLSKNGVSSIPSVFELSLAIFLSLLSSFKAHLKSQVEVFFKEIFLNILGTAASSFQHKWMVMQALAKVCDDPQTIVDLYVNYDCDLATSNLFERLVGDLSKMAQGRQSLNLGGIVAPEQEHKMRVKGLECLVSILRSMSVWCQDLADNNDDLAADVDENSVLNAGGEETTVAEAAAAAAARAVVDNPEQFELLKHQKVILEKGLELFKSKPSKGITFLIEQRAIGAKPAMVAEFLLTTPQIDKTAKGEYLGEPGDFQVEVMYAYVDLLDFSPAATSDYVGALRKFLDGFRLPGEAQKISRLMEKFASKYCESNPHNGIFANADAAYVLAYSIIMLTTDLHNPQVRKKMTKEEFLRNNRGINDTKDLPPEYLGAIYDEIANDGIKMKGDKLKLKAEELEGLSDKQKQRLYGMEMDAMVEAAQQLLKDASRSKTSFFTQATHIEHARPMFKLAWTSTLAAFSVNLKQAGDDESALVALCLEGFVHGIRVSSLFGMDLERDAFMQSLAKFTHLTTTMSEMQHKSVATIKTLITIAHTDGNYLRGSWIQVLKCISQLELAQLIGTGVRTNSIFMDGGAGHGTTSQARVSLDGGRTMTASSEHSLRRLTRESLAQVQETLGETNSQSVLLAVDRIFTGSIRLSGDAIVDFVRALCVVSLDELGGPHPRMFSLTKMVEIAYYNMGRIRLEWSRVWSVMGEHFNKMGCQPNLEVAIFSLDSLRQLSMKFLEKGELAGYHFQKDFLKPFEFIMNHNKSLAIRDMVVRCLAQMVQSKASNIRSGWKNIFFVFSLAASDNDEAVTAMAFETARIIFQNYFPLIVDCFMDGINCLVEFACNTSYPDISAAALDLIDQCALQVVQNPRRFRDGSDTDVVNSEEDDKLWVKGWFPVLFGLTRVINRCKLDVRTRALTMIFAILKRHGPTFKNQWWKDIFRVIFRIFDDLKLPESMPEKTEWMNTTCSHALYAIVNLFTVLFPTLAPILLDEIFDHFHWCVMQDNEQLARTGTHCLLLFVLANGHRFCENTWGAAVVALKRLFEDTLPQSLLLYREGPPEDVPVRPKMNFHSVIIQCIVQLELIQIVQSIVLQPPDGGMVADIAISSGGFAPHIAANISPPPDGMYNSLHGEQLITLLDCLSQSYDFSRSFNQNHELQTALWKAGFMKQPPNLWRQETSSLAVATRLLFRLYADPAHVDIHERTEERLISSCEHTLRYFSSLSEKQRQIWTPVVVLILRSIATLNEERFLKHVKVCFQPITELIVLDTLPELRTAVKDVILLAGERFGIMPPESALNS